jgi:hypothetical protein
MPNYNASDSKTIPFMPLPPKIPDTTNSSDSHLLNFFHLYLQNLQI